MNVKGFSILAVALMVMCSFIGCSLTSDDSDASTFYSADNPGSGTFTNTLWDGDVVYLEVGTTVNCNVSLGGDVIVSYGVSPNYGLTMSEGFWNGDCDLQGTITRAGTIDIYIDGSATEYDDEGNMGGEYDVTMTATIYAISTSVNHTITYNGNGATSGSVGNTVVTDTNNGNSYVTLAGNGFYKAGYTFVGWSVNGVTYQPGQSVQVGANASVTAVAQWSLNTVTASANGLSGLSGLSYSIQVNAQANNGATFTFAVKSCSAGTASVSSAGMVTFNAPSVSSTTNCNVVVTVTAHYPDGQTKTADAAFTVTIDPVLVFTNSVTSGTLSIKGA